MSPLNGQITAQYAPTSDDGAPLISDAYLRHRIPLEALPASCYDPEQPISFEKSTLEERPAQLTVQFGLSPLSGDHWIRGRSQRWTSPIGLVPQQNRPSRTILL